MNYLYQITNLINNKIYIGVHKTDRLDDGYMGSGTKIIRAIEKYGIENFRKEILEFFDTYEDALDKERCIVNEEFLQREDVYNINLGGQDSSIGARLGGHAYRDNVRNLDGEDLESYQKRMREQSAKGVKAYKDKYIENNGIWWKNGFKDKNHSEESKKKMSGPRPQSSREKNSQYETCWITKKRENKKIKKEDLDLFLSQGWEKGRFCISIGEPWRSYGAP
jgi:group I intron endonuclease